MLASREETHGGFIRLKMSHWRLLPVLDIDAVSQEAVKALSRIFEDFQSRDLGRIPEQYSGPGRDLRAQLDLAFLAAVGIQVNEGDLASLYDEISASLVQWLGE